MVPAWPARSGAVETCIVSHTLNVLASSSRFSACDLAYQACRLPLRSVRADYSLAAAMELRAPALEHHAW